MPLVPPVEFPGDPGLSGASRLFDGEWVWQAYCNEFGRPEFDAHQIRVRHFNHSPGRGAIVSYALEWPPDAYLPPELFTVRILRAKPVELFRYPEDAQLPGLKNAARPDTALRLVNKHVFVIPVRRVSVDVVRYRPGSRAVLRHGVGKVTFYVRVLRPVRVAPLLAAADLVARSEFVAPRLAGDWKDGGVLWFSEIPGRNLRRHIQRGKLPDPALLLDGLESLWNMPHRNDSGRAFDLKGPYRRAKRIFTHALQGSEEGRRSLKDAALSLDHFVETWRPVCHAHNDFYDDQMLALPDGRLALVDFEELGPGDPMLDVGNFLAHLRWTSRFGPNRYASVRDTYRRLFQSAALERFHWDKHELALREAVCLFRMGTSAIRHIRHDWRSRLQAGLSLVNEISREAA